MDRTISNLARPKGSSPVKLPEGVSRLDWELEKVKLQNPKIRAFLGCTHILEEVLDSNYAILHCSPDRLLEIWRRVGRAASLIRSQISPLLMEPSVVPDLESARKSAVANLAMLERTVLVELDRYPTSVRPSQLLQIRKILCVSIGKLHAFLQDTLSQLMGSDPRSAYDADYFLSKQFPQDIEEAEWLYTTVDRLQTYLTSIGNACADNFSSIAELMSKEKALPSKPSWEETDIFLRLLLTDLTPLVKQTLALRGIRFDEMEVLDRYAFHLPTQCSQVLEFRSLGEEIVESLTGETSTFLGPGQVAIESLTFSHAILARRMAALLQEIEKTFRDLISFVPLWLSSIEHRRALLLKKTDQVTSPG